MAVRKIILPGNPELLKVCTEVQSHEVETACPIIRDLFEPMPGKDLHLSGHFRELAVCA